LSPINAVIAQVAFGERAIPSAVVNTCKNSVGRHRHFAVDAEGRVTEHASYQETFGSMLLKLQPIRGFTG